MYYCRHLHGSSAFNPLTNKAIPIICDAELVDMEKGMFGRHLKGDIILCRLVQNNHEDVRIWTPSSFHRNVNFLLMYVYISGCTKLAND